MAVYDYITDQGVIVPDESEIVEGVKIDFQDVWGPGANVDDHTPNGMLIASEASARIAIAQNNANLANQLNPNFAVQSFLDVLLALLGEERDSEEFTLVPSVITGVAGTIVPEGSIAALASGEQFGTTSEVTLVPGDNAVSFQALEAGPLEVTIGSLTVVVSDVLGWETVNNLVAGTAGALTESDAAARQSRRDKVGQNARTVPAAQIADVLDVPNVLSMTYRDNPTDAPVNIDGVLLPANSIYACVEGGTDSAVGTALLESKGGGTPWAGTDVSVNIIEPSSGQSYTISFDRPDAVVTAVSVTVNVPQGFNDPVGVITQSVLDYAAEVLRIGVDVSPFEIAAFVNSDHPTLLITKVEVGVGPGFGSISTDTLVIDVNQKSTVDQVDIQVIIL